MVKEHATQINDGNRTIDWDSFSVGEADIIGAALRLLCTDYASPKDMKADERFSKARIEISDIKKFISRVKPRDDIRREFCETLRYHCGDVWEALDQMSNDDIEEIYIHGSAVLHMNRVLGEYLEKLTDIPVRYMLRLALAELPKQNKEMYNFLRDNIKSYQAWRTRRTTEKDIVPNDLSNLIHVGTRRDNPFFHYLEKENLDKEIDTSLPIKIKEHWLYFGDDGELIRMLGAENALSIYQIFLSDKIEDALEATISHVEEEFKSFEERYQKVIAKDDGINKEFKRAAEITCAEFHQLIPLQTRFVKRKLREYNKGEEVKVYASDHIEHHVEPTPFYASFQKVF